LYYSFLVCTKENLKVKSLPWGTAGHVQQLIFFNCFSSALPSLGRACGAKLHTQPLPLGWTLGGFSWRGRYNVLDSNRKLHKTWHLQCKLLVMIEWKKQGPLEWRRFPQSIFCFATFVPDV
jgi:hypothetical protein